MEPFEAIKTLVHFTNDANQQILEISSEIDNSYPHMEELANEYLNLTEKIFNKLNEDEKNALIHYNNYFNKINESHLALFKLCIAIQNEQNLRTETAIDIYKNAVEYYNK